jgi:hypothetical protein
MGKRITDRDRIKTLTDPIIKGLKPRAASFEIADAVVPGLFIRVQPSGFKGFTLHARPPGKKFTRLAIARYGEKPLADVRDSARDWIEKISGASIRRIARSASASMRSSCARRPSAPLPTPICARTSSPRSIAPPMWCGRYSTISCCLCSAIGPSSIWSRATSQP